MSKKAPSTAQLLVIAGFALSCFGILLFLWITFGGPTPFKAKPYELEDPLPRGDPARRTVRRADLRRLGRQGAVDRRVARTASRRRRRSTSTTSTRRSPRGTRAILRTKTLLGETYVELTPGNRNGPVLHDGGTLPRANVAESVQLDEIFRTFDKPTRRRLPGMDAGRRHGDRGPGRLALDRVRRVRPLLLRIRPPLPAARHAAARGAASCSATAPPRFRALRGREGQLASLIRNSNAVFQHDRGARPRHRSAVPRLPDLRGPAAPDLQPAEDVRAQRRPAVPPARPGGQAALADPDRLLAPGAAGQGLLRRAGTGDRPRPERARRAAQVPARRLPGAAAGARPVPAQPQPDRSPGSASTRTRSPRCSATSPRRPTPSTSARRANRSTTCA